MRSLPAHAVAVIGMVGRFPGAADLESLWQNMVAGREGIRFWRDEELDPAVPAALRQSPAYVRAKGVLEDCDRFDAAFFGITPLEAQLMDPQHRVLLEFAWAALEASAHRPTDAGGRIGVFVGANWTRYRTHNVATNPAVTADFGELNTALANEADFLATRISYKLDLKGPSCTVSTACSTSLVAIAQAARALANGECDVALAGGASVTVPVQSGYLHEPEGMLSRDGHCRPFDAAGTGTTFNDGVGVVVLRRLADAVADGDIVHAVIRGHAINNDGADKVSFTAPSVAGQASVLQAALRHAGIGPETVGYIETHGTATPLGDPIEFAALVQAYRGRDLSLRPCALGSVKSGIGHCVHAAGVAGFAMAVMAVAKGVMPPTLFFRSPNPRLQIERSRFFVPNAPRRWVETGQPRRAAVSSFGVGGTNAHVVIEEAPIQSPRPEATPRASVLCVSARSEPALQRSLQALGEQLAGSAAASWSDVAATSQLGRVAMRHRAAVVANAPASAAQALRDGARVHRGDASSPRRAVFLFPGYGVQRIGMGRELYAAWPVFRHWIDEGANCLLAAGRTDPRPWLLAPADAERSTDADLSRTLPALFLFEYALAAALEREGLVAESCVGYSLGEFAAAAHAGVLAFDAAVRLVAEVAAAATTAPVGCMFTAHCAAAEVPVAGDGLAIAAVNASEVTVLAGRCEVAAAVRGELEARGVRTFALPVERAFHTAAMDPVARALEHAMAGVALAPPQRPIFSAMLARELTAEEACSARHWSQVLRQPMQLPDTLAQLGDGADLVLVEVGPGGGMTAMALQHAIGRLAHPVAAQPGTGSSEQAVGEAMAAVAHAWVHGVDVQFASARQNEPWQRVALPTYPFERTRHWLEPGRAVAPPAATVAANGAAPSAVSPAPAGERDLGQRLAKVLTAVSGLELDASSTGTWADTDFDSLTITQLAISVRREFSVELTFRDLMERLGSPAELLQWLQARVAPTPAAPAAPTAAVAPTVAASAPAPASAEPVVRRPNPGARIERTVSEDHRLAPEQRAWLDRFLADYAAHTAKSKAFAQRHRRHLSDPRTVSGFHPLLKEIVYPIVTERSRGSRLWDLDGNEYVDFLNGFGCILFGHSPDFITQAVQDQLALGIEVGPQTPLAGEVAELFCRLTGNDRVAFSNTGSEAVAGALRVARTVTGRDKVVMFEGSYHGIFDEVVARAGPRGEALPGSPGIPRSHVGDVVLLPYGVESSLREIERLGPELAAVLVEPVQSRRPDLQPVEFLREVRRLTSASGTALILDEVVTGFRTHPGGIQALFGVRADMAIYGKVVAGGHPIGLIGGSARFLDALDGGQWQFGDDSVPEVGVTFFAGTFVRHPVALASTRAVLRRLLEAGPSLQEDLGRRATAMVGEIQSFLSRIGARVRIASFRSMMFVSATNENWSSLLFAGLRRRGIHIWDHFPCFLTTAHTDDDLARFRTAFVEVVTELVKLGLLTGQLPDADAVSLQQPPVPGARLGRSSDGTLAWFIADPDRPGKFLEVARTSGAPRR